MFESRDDGGSTGVDADWNGVSVKSWMGSTKGRFVGFHG